jgi:hypothetical protein
VRTAHGLPLLQRNAVLDAIAQEHAHAVLRAQTPKIEIAGARRPYARVFELLDQVESAAVDVFVATSPLTATESVNLLKAQHSLVGIGLVTGTTDQFGSDRYWMVVIYAGVRS